MIWLKWAICQRVWPNWPRSVKLLEKIFMQGAFPMKIKGIHLVHHSRLVNVIVAMAWPFLSKKLRGRVSLTLKKKPNSKKFGSNWIGSCRYICIATLLLCTKWSIPPLCQVTTMVTSDPSVKCLPPKKSSNQHYIFLTASKNTNAIGNTISHRLIPRCESNSHVTNKFQF